jgi:hypothetical protein
MHVLQTSASDGGGVSIARGKQLQRAASDVYSAKFQAPGEDALNGRYF